jgi:hypothetical protein
MEALKAYIPYLIPVIVIQLILLVAGLVDLARRTRTNGPKWLWLIIILFVNIVGPIIYFVIGRVEEE